MPRRFYSSTAISTTLNGAITNSATSLVVTSAAGFPASFPYTLILEPNTVNEEVVSVTAAAGTTLTVTRGQDGTSGVAHSTAVSVIHGVSARDFDEPNAHVNASAGVHGLAGSVVGTTDTQTLTNKNLTGAGNTFPTSLATLTGSQVLTNKDMTSGTNTFPTTVVTLTGSQTLTNKTLTSPTLTTPAIASFTNAQHDHLDADDGGMLTTAAITGLVAQLNTYARGLKSTAATTSTGNITETETLVFETGFTAESGRAYQVRFQQHVVDVNGTGDTAGRGAKQSADIRIRYRTDPGGSPIVPTVANTTQVGIMRQTVFDDDSDIASGTCVTGIINNPPNTHWVGVIISLRAVKASASFGQVRFLGGGSIDIFDVGPAL